MSGALVRTDQGEQSFVPAEQNGTILLETLQRMVRGAVGLTFQCDGKVEPVSQRGKELLPPMDGWGDRVYSVISKEAPGGSGAAAEKESRDGWAGQFPVHLHARDVENAFVAEMARRGHGAVEDVRVIMNNGKTGWYICFKSDHLSEMLGSYSFPVGATRCPKLTVDYHRKARKEVVQKRALSIDEGAGSETKRLKVALDTEVAENRRMRGEVLELRTSPMVKLMQDKMIQQAREFAERENELKSSIAVLEEEKKQKVKEVKAMRSLLEQVGLGSGHDLDQLVEATAMSLEDEKGGEDEQSRKVAEGKEKELGEDKTKEGEAEAQSKEMAEQLALLMSFAAAAAAIKQNDLN